MRNLSRTPQEIIISIIEALHTNPRAFALGMNQPYSKIYDIYRGKTRIFSNNVINSIMETYKIRRTYLATGEGEMFEGNDVLNMASGSGDAVTDSLLVVISTMKEELSASKKRVKELENMLHKAIGKYPDIAELLSDCLIEEPNASDNQ